MATINVAILFIELPSDIFKTPDVLYVTQADFDKQVPNFYK